MIRYVKRLVVVAAVLGGVAVPGHGQSKFGTPCVTTYGMGAFARKINSLGALSTDWTQILTCGPGSNGNGCQWTLSIQVYQLTRIGYAPASFSRGGSSAVSNGYSTQCDSSQVASLNMAWGNLAMNFPFYSGGVKIVWTIFSGNGTALLVQSVAFSIPN